MVVAVAMLGSLTVLPALLSRLGDGVDRRPLPSSAGGRADGESRIWGCDRRPRPAAAGAVRGARRRAAPARSRCPRSRCACAEASPDTFPAHLDVIKTYKRMQQAFPGTALPANVIVKAPNVDAPAMRGGDRAARAAGARERPHARADHGRRQHGRHGREHHDPDRRATAPTRHRTSRLPPAAHDARPADGRRRAERRGRRHRADRSVEGLQSTRSGRTCRSSSPSCSCSRSR